MAEAAVLTQPSNSSTQQALPLGDELVQYDRILSLRDDIFAGKHPRLKLAVATEVEAPAVPSSNSSKLPNGGHVPEAVNRDKVSANSHFVANNSHTSQAKAISPPQHSSGLNPIFLQESEVVIKAKMKLERQRIERSIQEQIKHRRDAARHRTSDQDMLPEFDVSEVYFQATELVKPIQASEANTANRRVSSSDTVDDNTYYSSQANDSATEESDDRPKRRATKPCKFYFEGTCKKGANCTFSHDPAFRKKLQPTYTENPERDSGPNSRTATHGYTAKGGRIRDSPTYDSRESGELVEDAPYSPSMQVPIEDRHRPPPNDQHSRTRHERNRSRAEARPIRRATPPSKEGRVVRNHITSPAAPQPSRVSPLAVAKVSRVDRAHHDTGEPSPRHNRQAASGQQTPVIAAPPKSRKRRRDLDASEAVRNVAPRRQVDSPGPYIKEEPVSPPPPGAVLAPTALVQQEEVRRPVEMGPPSPRYGDRVVYQPLPEEYSHMDVSAPRRVSSPSVRRVVSGSAPRQEIYREPDLRRVVSTRYIERPVSSHHDYVSVSGPPRSARAMSHYAAPPEEAPQVIYRSSVQPQRPVYVPDERPTSPVRYSRQPQAEPEMVPMAPPPRRIIVDEHGNRYYEAPMTDRRASAMPEVRYAPQVSRHMEQVPAARASVRPENGRVYHEDGYARRMASPGPPSPQYVQYRASVQPSSRRAIYEHDVDLHSNRNELVRVVEYPQERRMEREDNYQRPRESVARMQSARPNEVQYEVPNERYQRVQTVQPEQHRYVDLGQRDGPAYVREVREVSVRPEERYAPPEYVEAGRSRYRYVPNMYGMGPGARIVEEGDGMMG